MRRTTVLLGVVALLATGACSDDADGPLTLEASLTPHPVSTVSAVLEASTSRDAEITVEVRGDHGTFAVPVGDDPSEVPVVGMRAESRYEVVVRATPEDGPPVEEVLPWTTGALPADLPPVRLDVHDAARVQPGVTVLNVMPFATIPEGTEAPDAGFVLAVDAEGHVVWYHRMPLQLLDVAATRRGTFLVTAGETAIHEIDLLGRTVREWAGRVATDRGTDLNGRSLVGDDPHEVEIDSAHHEVLELPNGHVLTLSTELLEISPDDAERLCPDDPSTTLIGDVVVELDPDGDVVQEWKLSDVYDPTERPGAEMCLPQLLFAPPMWFYPDADDPRDWTHANAIALDVEANALLVSLRHLDAVVALRYRDDDDGPAGELLWELGRDGTLDLTSGEHPAHQHAHELLGDGELLVYDNGNGKGPPPYSRAVIYRLDTGAGTAEQVWEHRDVTPEGRPMFTPFLGDADRLANGNVLITHGGAAEVIGDFSTLYGRLVEVDRASGDVVWDLVVGDTGAWTVYRAERHPSLYELRP